MVQAGSYLREPQQRGGLERTEKWRKWPWEGEYLAQPPSQVEAKLGPALCPTSGSQDLQGGRRAFRGLSCILGGLLWVRLTAGLPRDQSSWGEKIRGRHVPIQLCLPGHCRPFLPVRLPDLGHSRLHRAQLEKG